MISSTEQFSAAARSQIASQLSFTTSLTDKMMESMEKMVGLNLQAAKATLEASVNSAQKILSAKDPQEFFSLTANQAQPQAELALTYGRHLASIASSTQIELTKVAESQIAENSRKLNSLFDKASEMAPAGSESAIAIMKSALDNANSSYEQISKNTKLAVEAIESNINAAATQLSQATSKTGSRSKK